MKTLVRIEGLSCEHCVKHVNNALLEISNVSNIVISLSQQEYYIQLAC